MEWASPEVAMMQLVVGGDPHSDVIWFHLIEQLLKGMRLLAARFFLETRMVPSKSYPPKSYRLFLTGNVAVSFGPIVAFANC